MRIRWCTSTLHQSELKMSAQKGCISILVQKGCISNMTWFSLRNCPQTVVLFYNLKFKWVTTLLHWVCDAFLCIYCNLCQYKDWWWWVSDNPAIASVWNEKVSAKRLYLISGAKRLYPKYDMIMSLKLLSDSSIILQSWIQVRYDPFALGVQCFLHIILYTAICANTMTDSGGYQAVLPLHQSVLKKVSEKRLYLNSGAKRLYLQYDMILSLKLLSDSSIMLRS